MQCSKNPKTIWCAWTDDNVIFPQQAAQNNLHALNEAMGFLEKGEIAPALESFYSIDNNCYAFQFERDVFYHFTEYIMKQSPDRLMWGKDESFIMKIFMIW